MAQCHTGWSLILLTLATSIPWGRTYLPGSQVLARPSWPRRSTLPPSVSDCSYPSTASHPPAATSFELPLPPTLPTAAVRFLVTQPQQQRRFMKEPKPKPARDQDKRERVVV